MSDVLQIKRPAAGQTLTYLVLSDVHSFYYNKSVFKKSLKILKQVPEKQRRVILLGDILDCEYLHASHPVFNKAVKEKLYEEHFLLEFENEVAWFEEFLEDIVEVTGTYKSIYFSEGNHEQRLRRSNFIDNCSHSLRANFDLFRNLNLKKRGIPYIKYNDFFLMKASKSPDLYLTHGMYCSMLHGKKHFDSVHSSVLYGHVHDYRVRSFPALQTMFSIANPCLCETNPSYLDGRINNWSVGFTMINRTSNHIFHNTLIAQDNQVLDMFGRKY